AYLLIRLILVELAYHRPPKNFSVVYTFIFYQICLTHSISFFLTKKIFPSPCLPLAYVDLKLFWRGIKGVENFFDI
ncbi:MAG: hypothetical protein IJT06_06355, partial [Selenomonadaceae bacterium]|nr:hypothetical protein [Selenomonadaceae bacterium]